jgi:superfamily II DNA or RNA helicase
MGKKHRHAIADQLLRIPRDEARVLLATGKYVGEGFDDPRLDTLFLTLPISWRGTVAQYVGRLHRLYDGKSVPNACSPSRIEVPNAVPCQRVRFVTSRRRFTRARTPGVAVTS